MNSTRALFTRTKKILLVLLSALMVLSVGFGMFGILNNAKAASYDFVLVNDSMDTAYCAYWRGGQGQRVNGQTSGRWYFGYGDIAANGAYSFNQATYDNSAGNQAYTTGTAHSYYWCEELCTRLYSTSGTQSMFKWYAESAGTVTFSGLVSKATSDKQVLGGTQNGYDKLWIAGPNWGNGNYNWVSGDAYTIGMYKVDGSTGAVSCLSTASYSNEFVWLVPKDTVTVKAGDEIYFAYRCDALSSSHDEWKTNTLAFFTSQFTADPNATTQGEYEFSNKDNLNVKYVNHWRVGNNQHVSGETNGLWNFGYGDVAVGKSLSFTAANVSVHDSNGNMAYTSVGTHTMYYQFNTSTRLYSNANTQSMFVMTAEKKGYFTFSGLFSKATSDKQVLGGTQNNYNPIWIAGINHVASDFNWINGQSYTVGMFKVAANGTVTAISNKTFTSEYCWLVPQDQHLLEAGDKMVFTLKCNATSNEAQTNTLTLLSSTAVDYVENPDVVVPDEPNEDEQLPTTLPDITAPTTGFNKVAHYKFESTANIGVDAMGNYNLENSGLTVDSTMKGVKLSDQNFMYAPKIAQNNNDFSDLMKGSFSISFKAYACESSEDGERHVILTTGSDGDGKEYFAVSWEGKDLVVVANGQDYRIDNAKVENDDGVMENVYMLDETPSWYRYTIIYDETDAEAMKLIIRIDRFNAEGTRYGTMTVVTEKKIYEKITFGGTIDYSFSIGAQSTMGTFQDSFASGSSSKGQAFSPYIADLRIYSGVVDEAEILQIWKDDEAEVGWFDRSASYLMTIVNDAMGGSVTGAKTNIKYGVNTALNISVSANTGYLISSIMWNNEMISVTNRESMTFSKSVTEDVTLKINYERIKKQVKVYQNDVLDTAISGSYGLMSTFTLTATPKEGNRISGVTINGEPLAKTDYDSDGFSRDILVTGDIEVKITYEKVLYNLSFKVAKTTAENTKVSYKSDANYKPQKCTLNSIATLTLTAPEGNEIKEIKVKVSGVGGKTTTLDLSKSSGDVKITKNGDYVTAVTFSATMTNNVEVSVHFNQVGEVSGQTAGGEEELVMAGCESGILSVELGFALVAVAGALLVVKKLKKSK